MVMRWFRIPAFLVLILALPLAFGCSSDDDPTDPGGGDTTPPTVQTVSPADGTLMVPTDGSLTVQFDEAMDPIDPTGQITMSHGTLVSADWVGDTSLTINYSGWPQALYVTVSLGTGFKDVAGNSLADIYVMGLGTRSDNLFVFGTTPAGGATDVNRAAVVDLDFGAYVEEASLMAGVTISDGAKVDLPYTASSADGARWILEPDEFLPADTEITVTIGTSVVSTAGTAFAEPFVFSFTTNDQIDNTPPNILGIDPPSGSTMPTGTAAIVFTFDERINPDNFRPTAMNGQLLWLIDQAPSDPWWNGAGDVLTVPLPADLPAGLALEATFADYEDMAGNVQTGQTPWAVTVAGTAQPYPLRDGQRYLMAGEVSWGEAGSEVPTDSSEEFRFMQITARGGATDFNLEEWDAAYTELWNYDIQRVNGSAISLIGFAEDDDGSFTEIMLPSPAVWAELPLVVGNTWSQSLSVVTPEGTIDVELDGEVVSNSDVSAGTFDGIEVTWTDVWHVRLLLDLSSGGTRFTLETDENWYVPGVGLIRNRNREDQYETGNEGWEISDVWLTFAE